MLVEVGRQVGERLGGITGGNARVAWVTAHGGRVHHNTIYLPDNWVLRILQESRDKRFKPCHGGIFEDNLIVFDRRVAIFVNIGPLTAPKTFTFRRNAWYERSRRRKPRLPTPEINGIYQVDPRLKNPGTAKMTITSRGPRLKRVGADAYQKPKERPEGRNEKADR